MKIHEAYGEIFHYTTASGLLGILASKTLWAVHTSFLNDSEEIVGFFDRVLPVLLRDPLDEYVKERSTMLIFQQWASVLDDDPQSYIAKRLIQTLKNVLSRAQDHYVACFCTTSDPWQERNGLLSQWRGYGEDGGYAIVFDSEKLSELLGAEGGTFPQTGLSWADIEYRMDDESLIVDDDNKSRIRLVKEAVRSLLRDIHIDEKNSLFTDLPFLASICKHRGFAEEKEVRVVVSEPSQEVRIAQTSTLLLPGHVVHHFVRNGVLVPCVHLFATQNLTSLPIKRIIVGPHPEKHSRGKAVESLLFKHGIGAEVVLSETPFRSK